MEVGAAAPVAICEGAGGAVGMGALDTVAREVSVATEVGTATCVPTAEKELTGRPVGTDLALGEDKGVALGFKEGVAAWDRAADWVGAEEVVGASDDPVEVEAEWVAVLLGSMVFEKEGEEEETGLLVEV